MSVSKYHYVKFLDEVEEISNSKTESENKFDFSEENTNMSSTNYTDRFISMVDDIKKDFEKQKKEIDFLKKENQDLKKENEKLKTFETDTKIDPIHGKNESELKDEIRFIRFFNTESIKGYNKLKEEYNELKKENDELKKKTFEADTRCDGIKIKMNTNWLWEDVYPVLEDRDHMKNYFDELEDLPDNLDYDITFKEDMEELFYENLTLYIQRRLNMLNIFGGIHSAHNLDEMVCEDIHDFINQALTDGNYFEIEVEEEDESEESGSDIDIEGL